MNTGKELRQPAGDRLRFLAETVLAEAELFQITDRRRFAEPMDSARASTFRQDIELAERVYAFVARFDRLQDTVGDKLLPGELVWLAKPVGPAIDNLARAERPGWVSSAAAWIADERRPSLKARC